MLAKYIDKTDIGTSGVQQLLRDNNLGVLEKLEEAIQMLGESALYNERKFLDMKKICIKWSLIITLLFALGVGLYIQEVSAGKISEDVQSENEISESGVSEFAKSKHMWKYNGTIYTVKDIQRAGYISISGNYVDTMAIYKDRIYWRKTTDLGHFPCEIIQMNMDCTEQKVLTESADSYIGITIYKDWLYYISLEQNEKRIAKK